MVVLENVDKIIDSGGKELVIADAVASAGSGGGNTVDWIAHGDIPAGVPVVLRDDEKVQAVDGVEGKGLYVPANGVHTNNNWRLHVDVDGRKVFVFYIDSSNNAYGLVGSISADGESVTWGSPKQVGSMSEVWTSADNLGTPIAYNKFRDCYVYIHFYLNKTTVWAVPVTGTTHQSNTGHNAGNVKGHHATLGSTEDSDIVAGMWSSIQDSDTRYMLGKITDGKNYQPTGDWKVNVDNKSHRPTPLSVCHVPSAQGFAFYCGTDVGSNYLRFIPYTVNSTNGNPSWNQSAASANFDLGGGNLSKQFGKIVYDPNTQKCVVGRHMSSGTTRFSVFQPNANGSVSGPNGLNTHLSDSIISSDPVSYCDMQIDPATGVIYYQFLANGSAYIQKLRIDNWNVVSDGDPMKFNFNGGTHAHLAKWPDGRFAGLFYGNGFTPDNNTDKSDSCYIRFFDFNDLRDTPLISSPMNYVGFSTKSVLSGESCPVAITSIAELQQNDLVRMQTYYLGPEGNLRRNNSYSTQVIGQAMKSNFIKLY